MGTNYLLLKVKYWTCSQYLLSILLATVYFNVFLPQSDSSLAVENQIDELIGAKSSSSDTTFHETSLVNRRSFLNIANLKVENNDRSRRKKHDLNTKRRVDKGYKCEECGKLFQRNNYNSLL